MFLLTVFGTNMTAFAILGSSGLAYQRGIGVYGLMASSSGLIIPLTILAIFFLLFMLFKSVRLASLIILVLPFASIGGVFGLFIAGEYLSVPAAVGFINLWGIAVLNGVVLVSYFNQLHAEGLPLLECVTQGARRRLRPVMMTAAITAFGLVVAGFMWLIKRWHERNCREHAADIANQELAGLAREVGADDFEVGGAGRLNDAVERHRRRVGPDFLQRCGNSGGLGVELEVLVYSVGEVADALQDRG